MSFLTQREHYNSNYYKKSQNGQEKKSSNRWGKKNKARLLSLIALEIRMLEKENYYFFKGL